MEAAACYIGETKDPDRDAKIAMNLEGAYGLFIYTMIPVAFIIVLGLPALGNAALVDPKTIFVHYAAAVFGAGTGSSILEWLIALMLILALILSALNAITGTARSLHQMSTDGQFPRFFQRVNQRRADRARRDRDGSGGPGAPAHFGRIPAAMAAHHRARPPAAATRPRTPRSPHHRPQPDRPDAARTRAPPQHAH
jgi:Amino acid permease